MAACTPRDLVGSAGNQLVGRLDAVASCGALSCVVGVVPQLPASSAPAGAVRFHGRLAGAYHIGFGCGGVVLGEVVVQLSTGSTSEVVLTAGVANRPRTWFSLRSTTASR